MPTSYDEEERIYHKGFRDGWRAGRAYVGNPSDLPANKPTKKRTSKRKASAYSKRYGAAFKRLAPKYKNKRGGWKKDGFKRAQKAAHKAARK